MKIIFFVYTGKFCGLPKASVLTGEIRMSKTRPFLLSHIIPARRKKVYFALTGFDSTCGLAGSPAHEAQPRKPLLSTLTPTPR